MLETCQGSFVVSQGSFVCETGLGKERDSQLRRGEYQLGASADLSGGATGCRGRFDA